MYKHIYEWKLSIDNSFHQVIVPITLEYLKVYTREHAITMYQMMMTILELNADN